MGKFESMEANYLEEPQNTESIKNASMDDMQVAMYKTDEEEWGNIEESSSNWSLCMDHATFQHKDSCEFIFYIGDIHAIEYYENLGFTESFLAQMKKAKQLQYAYICFYN